MIKVLIGLSPRFVFVCFFVFVFLSIGINLGRGPVGPQLEPHSSPRSDRGGMGRAACAGLRPVLPGLSDFASKGERRDTYVCKEGPSVWGSAKDLCSGTPALSGGLFPLIFLYFARTRPEYCFLPLHPCALLGAVWSL